MKINNSTKYLANNWLKDGIEVDALDIISAKGGALAMNDSGALLYRLLPDKPFLESKDYKAISEVFTNFIGEKVELITGSKQKKSESDEDLQYIAAQDLKLVVDTKFDPHTPREFIDGENGLCCLNKYTPSYYMQLECNNIDSYGIDAVLALVSHLSNHDRQRLEWIVNWLAYFFQGLKKSQVALVLRGDQGAGKGILFTEVIAPLFGKQYCKAVNDKTLDSQYLGGLVEDTLFFNLDEISSQKSKSKSLKNFLKALVTNDTITAEKKFKTVSRDTPIYAQILITSNEVEVLEIEPSDRRYTVFNTAGNLNHVDFLGYRSYKALSQAIKDELEAFACYLGSYKVDIEKAQNAIRTQEKDELINLYLQKQQKHLNAQLPKMPKLSKLQMSIQEFGNAIMFKNLTYFESIRFDEPELYDIVINDLNNNLFRISNLLSVFKALGGRGLKTNSELLRELQNFNLYFFGSNNIVTFRIDNRNEECFRVNSYYPIY